MAKKKDKDIKAFIENMKEKGIKFSLRPRGGLLVDAKERYKDAIWHKVFNVPAIRKYEQDQAELRALVWERSGEVIQYLKETSNVQEKK